MPASHVRVSTFLVCLMLAQLGAPIAFAQPSPDVKIETNADLDLLSQLGISPNMELASGWYDSDLGAGTVDLLHRDATVTPIEKWQTVTGEKQLNGNYIITHTYPIPSDWVIELEEADIACYSFIPATGFHCEIDKQSVGFLASLGVEGVVKLDPTDKIRTRLAQALLGLDIGPSGFFYADDVVPINVVLSGVNLPQDIEDRTDIDVHYHVGRFATLYIDKASSALAWLAEQDEIEWMEERLAFLRTSVEAEANMVSKPTTSTATPEAA